MHYLGLFQLDYQKQWMNKRTAPPSIEVLSLDFPLPVSEYIHSLSGKYHDVIGYLGDVHHLCTKNALAAPGRPFEYYKFIFFFKWNYIIGIFGINTSSLHSSLSRGARL